MNYALLATELAEFLGMDDAAIAAALVAKTIPTLGPVAIMPSDFVARFMPDEAVAIIDSGDARVRALMLRLRTQLEPMMLNGPTVTQGLAYLAAKGLIAPERVAEVAAIPAGPMVARCEQIDCALMLEMDEPSRELAVKHAREISK